MTNRRKPTQRQSASWSPGRSRSELAKAIGGAAGVVIVTALVIFVIKPGDSGSSVPTQTPSATVPAAPTGSTGSTGATGTGATGSTGSPATTPPTTPATAPASSPSQP